MLRQLGEDLWVFERPHAFRGVEVGTRASVIRLASGELLVHSPVRFADDVPRAVDPLGQVRFLYAPNKVHHLMIGPWMAHYPAAQLYGPRGLAKKRPDLTFAGELGNEPPEPWRGQLDQRIIEGVPRFGEVALLHRRSRTLVLADQLFRFDRSHPFLTRMVARVLGWYGKWTWNERGAARMRDRAALRASIDQVLRWDFDRIVISHGTLCETGGREVLRAAYAWV
jgi:hypothetical protein